MSVRSMLQHSFKPETSNESTNGQLRIALAIARQKPEHGSESVSTMTSYGAVEARVSSRRCKPIPTNLPASTPQNKACVAGRRIRPGASITPASLSWLRVQGIKIIPARGQLVVNVHGKIRHRAGGIAA